MCDFSFVKRGYPKRGKVSCDMSLAKRIQKLKKTFTPKKVEEGTPSEKILSEHSRFFVKEAYKALRTNLIFSLTETGGKVILITSSGAAEGKSTSCLNLAITFADMGAKVCVVDCDLRKPSISRLCEEKGSPGLSNVLVNLNKLPEVIRKSKYNNMDVIYSGEIPPNPAELLSSNKMEEVLRELAQQYDYVFVDTPPVNVATDASLLAVKANGVLLVVRQGKTTNDELAEAIQQLEFVKARIIGMLFNDTKITSNKKGRYMRKDYYYKNYYSYTRLLNEDK